MYLICELELNLFSYLNLLHRTVMRCRLPFLRIYLWSLVKLSSFQECRRHALFGIGQCAFATHLDTLEVLIHPDLCYEFLSKGRILKGQRFLNFKTWEFYYWTSRHRITLEKADTMYIFQQRVWKLS